MHQSWKNIDRWLMESQGNDKKEKRKKKLCCLSLWVYNYELSVRCVHVKYFDTTLNWKQICHNIEGSFNTTTVYSLFMLKFARKLEINIIQIYSIVLRFSESSSSFQSSWVRWNLYFCTEIENHFFSILRIQFEWFYWFRVGSWRKGWIHKLPHRTNVKVLLRPIDKAIYSVVCYCYYERWLFMKL